MNDCINAEVRDALPDLFHGRLSALDTATMNAHVESCPDCRAELELMRQVRSSARIAPRVDASAIAATIPAYPAVSVPAQPGRVSIVSRINTLRIAAAAALIAIGGWALSNGLKPEPNATTRSASTASAVVPSAPDVAPSIPQVAPKSVDSRAVPSVRETQVADLSLVGSTEDLSDADLEKLVAELDGMETLPAAEPHSITITDEDIGTENDSTTR